MTPRVLRWSACLVAIAVGVAVAQDIPHEEVPFACAECHTGGDRSDVTFEHDETPFPLVGQHRAAGCRDCHDIADFSKVDGSCLTCHTDVHQARLDPDCETCHTPFGWTIIDHNMAHAQTAFQLIGAHVRLDCDACHPREIVAERMQLAWDCVDCHRADFESARCPTHTQSGFGDACESCHFQVSWHPSTFRNHQGDFPIFSGNHAGEWGSCCDCHTNPSDPGSFSCIDCHEHRQSAMDDEHEDVSGYWYASFACYGCHPDGGS